MADNLVICIARQFGSGGHEIGKALATSMGIGFYDKELLKEAAAKSGIHEDLFEKSDEKPSPGLLYSASGRPAPEKAMNFEDYTASEKNDKIQAAISGAISDAAEKSSCVIIGRCAAHVLRGRRNMLSVFLHANPEKRIQRIQRTHNLEEDAARALIRKTDQNRANYYQRVTGQHWDFAAQYALSFDAGALGVERSVKLIEAAAGIFCG